MKHVQYYRNIANGIARIAQAVKLCDEAPTEKGTIFSNRFSLFQRSINIPYGFQDMMDIQPISAHECIYKFEDVQDVLKDLIKPDEELLSPQTEYNLTFKLENLDQSTIDALRSLSGPYECQNTGQDALGCNCEYCKSERHNDIINSNDISGN
jgi:hypothetical protein